MINIEKMIQLADNMRFHEYLAEQCLRGSVERQHHEQLAQQFRDELWSNPPRTEITSFQEK